jgi:cytochrome c5
MRGSRPIAASIVLLIAGSAVLALTTSPRVEARSAQAPPTAADAASASRAVLDRYCVTCHNARMKIPAGNPLLLDTLDIANVTKDGKAWDKVVRKLRARAMPPAGSRRPDETDYERVVSHLETSFDRDAQARPNPGFVGQFHRLTRTEYANAVRDLLALDALPKELDIATLLPADNTGTGFDNLADLLFISPTQLDAYLAVAMKLSRLAVGDPTTPVIVDRYLLPEDRPQDVRVDGAPAGTRGGLFTRTHFPVDGEYRVKIEFAGNARDPHELEVTVDGQRVTLFTIGTGPPPERGSGVFTVPPDKPLEATFAMKAGPHLVGVAFIEHTPALSEQLVRPRRRSRGGLPAIASVTVSGPYTVDGSGDTPSRKRLFVCQPANPSGEPACAKKILSTLTQRAYRRASTDEDVHTLWPFYEAGRAEGGFERGIQQALERVLISPQFLFRIERDPVTERRAERRAPLQPVTVADAPSAAVPTAVGPVSDVELASRLSFFLWSSIPDDELLGQAIGGKLRDRAVLRQQVRRMLADPRSEALVSNFAAQWLFLRDVEQKRPDERLFPEFDGGLREALRRETELFLHSIVTEDRNVLDLLRADHTFVDERLARHYGMPWIYGPGFRRVTVADDYRRGLLGKGSILVLTSYSTRTSPVLRGKYVLSNLLGDEPPPPPPNVPSLNVENKSGKPLSMREAMVQHRANAVCSTCHARMDPIGFALDNFDAVGRWRTLAESGQPIDPSGVLPDGTKFDGIVGLREYLLERPYMFLHTMTEKLLTYSLGRSLEFYDSSVVRGVLRDAAREDYRFSSLIQGIVESTPFQMRASAAAGEAREAAARR